MNGSSLLGFAIPTYRRPELLDKALESIVPQAVGLEAPIYIPDNSCDDTNSKVVTKWQKIYPNIVHDINESNIGIDRNVDRAITGCPATYVHVIGDDDLILPGFAAQATRVIEEYSPWHIICSYMYLLNDYRPTTGKSIIPAGGHITSLRTFLPRSVCTLGFIGAHIFNRARFSSSTTEAYGSYFHHVARLISYIDPDEQIGFIDQPLVGNRVDDESTPTWSADRLNVVFGLEKTFSVAMSDLYSRTEIDATIASTRRSLGYTQYFRLVYWAALADRSGHGAAYWNTLGRLVGPTQYIRMKIFPAFLYGPLVTMIPQIRRLKRGIRASRLAKS